MAEKKPLKQKASTEPPKASKKATTTAPKAGTGKTTGTDSIKKPAAAADAAPPTKKAVKAEPSPKPAATSEPAKPKPAAKPSKEPATKARAAKPEPAKPSKAPATKAKAAKLEPAGKPATKAAKPLPVKEPAVKGKAAKPAAKPDEVKSAAKPATKAPKRTAPVQKATSRKAAEPTPKSDEADRRKKRKYTRRVVPAPAPVVAPKYQGKLASPSTRKTDMKAEGQKTQKGDVQYSREVLEFFRSIILDKIREANEELVSIEERLLDSSSGEFNDDDSTYSLHMADQGTDAMEREKAFLFAQRERKFISHLSDALQRISSGIYGICINCGDLIDKGRLEAVPHARMCVNCKNRSKQPE